MMAKTTPTLLQLTINGKPSKDEHEIVTKERIEQFVMESGFHVTVSDLDPTTDEEDAADSKHCQLRKNRENEEVNSSLTFYASPVARQAFVDAFEFALDQVSNNQLIIVDVFAYKCFGHVIPTYH